MAPVVFMRDTPKYISTSPVNYGYTNKYGGPGYNGGEYYSLASFQKFTTLEKVPTVWKNEPYTDCTVFPAREEFVDILPSTVLWMENRGCHMSPWDGRNCCIRIEDVCSHLADGLSVSAEENVLNRDGIKTVHQLTEGEPFKVNYIHGW